MGDLNLVMAMAGFAMLYTYSHEINIDLKSLWLILGFICLVAAVAIPVNTYYVANTSNSQNTTIFSTQNNQNALGIFLVATMILAIYLLKHISKGALQHGATQ
jgi:energy-coupling factor transporter transmembrane protein EcfT